jgi:hypothetical protein
MNTNSISILILLSLMGCASSQTAQSPRGELASIDGQIASMDGMIANANARIQSCQALNTPGKGAAALIARRQQVQARLPQGQ